MLTSPLDSSSPAKRWSADELIPFGKYILLNKINSGATAAVYRGKIRGEAGFERLVAVKRILPHMAGDPEFVSTFVREAKTAARLNHTNICPIYELGKVGESLYMAMEWVAGKDLGALTRRLHRAGEVMPPILSAWIAGRLCDALDYAHTLKDARGKPAGIIHRDLSPTNIVVSYEGQVKLIDFGLAKAVGRAQQTNVDALKKKLGYMSPELVKGKAPDARSDVFGVGVCLYEMVTSRRLFAGKDDMATLKMVSNASVPPPSALVEDAPEELETIIMRALERDPDQRWQTAGEMGQALASFILQNDPRFGPRQMGEWMVDHFRDDMKAEQLRVNELLEASHDPRIIEERRVFFASPAGAAAMAKAEVARRLSAEPPAAIMDSEAPPMSSEQAARNIPRAPAIPLVALAAGVSSHPPPAAISGSNGASDPKDADSFEDEPTGFFDPDKAAAEASAFGDDEPTNFFDGEAHAKAMEVALGATPPDTLPAPAIAEALAGAGERSEHLAGEAVNAARVEAGPETRAETSAEASAEIRSHAAPISVARESSFEEEEATHIFFNKEDGTGLSELLADDPDAPAASAAPARTTATPAPARTTPTPTPATAAHQRKGTLIGMAPAISAGLQAAQPTAAATLVTGGIRSRGQTPILQRPRSSGERARSTTLEMHSPIKPRGDRVSTVLMFVGLAMLGLAVAGLIAKTPLGIALGLRKPAVGAIEVRTTPLVNATVKLDGIMRGTTPLRMDGVHAGTRTLHLEAAGYLNVDRAIDLSGGTTAMIDVALVPSAPGRPLPSQPAP